MMATVFILICPATAITVRNGVRDTFRRDRDDLRRGMETIRKMI
jgi:hypothetical protein